MTHKGIRCVEESIITESGGLEIRETQFKIYSSMLANISRDLKKPLTVSLSNGEVLLIFGYKNKEYYLLIGDIIEEIETINSKTTHDKK